MLDTLEQKLLINQHSSSNIPKFGETRP